jgi:glycosyltransferase involved in cell wall biosynthesis
MSRIRIVRIIDRLNIGGPAKHVTWLTSGLDPARFETTLITGIVPESEGDMGYFARAAGVEPLIIREMSRELSLRDFIAVFKILRVLRRLKPQVVHTHKAKAGAAGRVAAAIYKWFTPSALWLRPRDCMIVHTYHGHIFHSYYGPLKSWVFVAIERALARFCTERIIVISEQQREEICRKYRVGRHEQFAVVPLGIDLEEIRPESVGLRDSLGIGENGILIVIAGRLCEVKNHSMVIRSVARLNREGIIANLAIVGDGHLRGELENEAEEMNARDFVKITGFRDDAASLFFEADVAALTSLNEGTPLSLIEAMRCGCALASTEVGGVVDLMGARLEGRDGFAIWEHGITAPSRDVEAFAAGLKFLIDNPETRRRMGENGRNFVTSTLSKERLIGDLEILYEDHFKRWRRNVPQVVQPAEDSIIKTVGDN